MNIVLKTAGGHVTVRPDTTWEKDNEDLYLPDFVSRLSYTPVLFVRISRPGRAVGRVFAPRYYDAFNYGVLLYPDDLDDGSGEGFAAASCLDKTSFLPAPLYRMEALGNPGNEFVLKKDGERIFSTGGQGRDLIDRLIAECSEKVYLRIGDLAAVELAPRKRLWDKEEGTVTVSGTYCGNFLLDFRIFCA